MSILDKILAILSLLAFAGFLLILIWFVPRPGLVLVCVVSIAVKRPTGCISAKATPSSDVHQPGGDADGASVIGIGNTTLRH